jgi:hypothetical protein
VCHKNPPGAFLAVVFPENEIVRPYEVVVPCTGGGDYAGAMKWIGRELLGCVDTGDLVTAAVERGGRKVSCLLRMVFRRPGGADTSSSAGGKPNLRAITLITPNEQPFIAVGAEDPEVKVRGDAVVGRCRLSLSNPR